MNSIISKIKCSVNKNDFAAMLLQERLTTLMKTLKVEVTLDTAEFNTIIIPIDRDGIEHEKYELLIDSDIVTLSTKHRDLYLFLIQAQILKHIDTEIYEYWVNIAMSQHIYFNTLLFSLSQSLPLLRNENNSIDVINKVLTSDMMKISLFKKIDLHVSISDTVISLSNSLYQTICFEYDTEILDAITHPSFHPISIKIDEKIPHDCFLLSVHGYQLFLGLVYLDNHPCESGIENYNIYDSYKIDWFDKEFYSAEQLKRDGYIVYDYSTLLQKIQQRFIQIVQVFNTKVSYESQALFIKDCAIGKRISKDNSNKTLDIKQSLSQVSHSCEDILKPSSILDKLNTTVAGHQKAKKELSSIFFWHMLTHHDKSIESLESSLLLAGSTGSGKTFMIQQLSNMFDLPFIHIDTSQLVPEGYRGMTVNDVIKEVLRKSSHDLDKAESCILFFDECDKLNSKNEYDRAVINQLLRFTEGANFPISFDSYDDKSEFNEISHINTHKMLKIFAGSFFHQVKSNISNVGFLSSSSKNITDETITDAFPPEFNGRISKKIILEKLKYQDIYELLKTDKNDISKMITKINYFGHEVEISDGVYQEIAKDVSNSPVGMRRIKHLSMQLFSPLLSIAPEIQPTTFVLNENDINVAITKTI